MELRTTTILFCDIAQSTRFASVLGEEEYGKLLWEYQTLGEVIVKRFMEGCKGRCEYDIRGDQICVIVYGDPVKDATALINLARDLKIAWFFSRYNCKERVKRNRSPVQIMIGIHAGEVALGDFSRSQNGKKVAEGYAISIAKRVESSARYGTSWQIMLTDTVLNRVNRRILLEFVRRAEMPLSEGVTYPVSEIINIEPQFNKLLRTVNMREKDAQKHLERVVQLEPTPWHCLLWSYWNWSISSQAPHYHALLTNPHTIGLAQRLALKCLHDKDPWQALILLDRAESRAGDRRYSVEYHGIIRAMAHLMIEQWQGDTISCQMLKSYCAPALNNPDWCYAAGIIMEILIAEGKATKESVPKFPAVKDSGMRFTLEVIRGGLALVRSRVRSVDENVLSNWTKTMQMTFKKGFHHYCRKAKMDVVSPLFAFYADLHKKSSASKISAEIYDCLSLL